MQNGRFHYLPVDSESITTPCYLTSIGTLIYDKGIPYPIKGHPKEFDFHWSRGRMIADYALVLIRQGCGEFQVDGDPLAVGAGDAFYLAPGQWHRYRPSERSGWTESWISLRGFSIQRYILSRHVPKTCTLLHGVASEHLLKQIQNLENDVFEFPLQNNPSWGARALAILIECFETPKNARCVSKEHTDGVVDRALRFIKESCHRSIGVNDVAQACGVNRRMLERCFSRAELGPVGRRIIVERIGRAEVLLADPDIPIKEIAFACGFGSPQRMIYDFHVHLKDTPGRYREKIQD